VLWYTYAGYGIPGIPKGSIIILREWYGGNAKGEGMKLSLHEIGQGIAERERGLKVEAGPADNQIYEEHGGMSIAETLAQYGVYFTRSDKARISGWNQLRARLKGDRDKPLIYVTRGCPNVIRTIPLLQHDDKKPEDINTDGDDHCADVVRYVCMEWPIEPQAIKDKEPMRGPQTYAELIEAAEDLVSANRRRH
jgi:hypothetical protein